MELDDLPMKNSGIVVGEALDLASVDELEQRIAALETEIVRVKAALEAKRASLNAAAVFFR